ncbi:unnamed protein product [Ceratitis capitata]|uniref:(Mediterranean fruit fly) hypothetical protein n=1 Tax=Ceratitis capitata TaxID=7213 RepID=A0A811U1R6_CERCA|nr:unnamed protein product [Ceratitis capitata]
MPKKSKLEYAFNCLHTYHQQQHQQQQRQRDLCAKRSKSRSSSSSNQPTKHTATNGTVFNTLRQIAHKVD